MANNTGNRDYLKTIFEKIDQFENPDKYPPKVVIVDEDTYGEVDGNSDTQVSVIIPTQDEEYENNVLTPLGSSLESIDQSLPQIDPARIEGVLDLYRDLNKRYGTTLNVEKVTTISSTFKEIVDPMNKEIYTIFLREYLDRLRISLLGQLGNTVYLLINKLTSEETIQTLTIMERMTLLDKLFEYMEKINNMMTYVPEGDTKTELMEIAQRQEDEGNGGSRKVGESRNREIEAMVLKLLKTGKI